MPTRTIETSGLRLEICPEAGASIVGFELAKEGEWVPVMRPTPPVAVAALSTDDMASFVLAPYSNRIRDARFSFGEKEYRLRSNFPDGTAIHGDVWKRPWKLVDEAPDSLTLSIRSEDFDDINFPFPFRVELEYALAGKTFLSTIRLTNPGNEPMPAGFGFHPYFQRTLTDADEEVELQAPVTGVYPGDTPLPTGPPVPLAPRQDFSALRPIGEPDLDHCFAGWNGRAALSWPGSGVVLKVECDPVFSHLVIYTPSGESFFAVEPVSNCNDGFNLAAEGQEGTGVQVLGPGEVLKGMCRMQLEW